MIEIVAHRGAGRDRAEPIAGEAHRPAAPPENTLPAFDWGWAATGACELDVHLTGDGRVLVVHDATTGRLCDRDLVVAESTLADLRRLDAGARKGPPWSGRGLRLPTLAEVFARMPEGARLYIEAKSGPEIVLPLLAEIDAARRPAGDLVLISFGIDTLAALKRARPDLACCWVLAFEERAPGEWQVTWNEGGGPRGPRPVTRCPIDYPDLLARTAGPGFRLDGLDLSRRQPEDLAAVLKSQGIPWGAWTVDRADVALALIQKGAVQLTSNAPLDLRQALACAAAGT